MPSVKILPPDIISKIAAGEVVERPASVVKELLENSLDAGANAISIDLTDSGKTEILIRDNGSGISKDDLENMFHRHATSKIRNVDDLYNIHSLGFRGEALYSISAIADVTLQTKTVDSNSPQPPLSQREGAIPPLVSKKAAGGNSDSGWEIHIRAGARQSLKPAPVARHGTTISVKELFFNTPARRKFLKTDATELNQIIGCVIPYALLRPDVSFVLKNDNRVLLDVSATDAPVKRVADVLKLETTHLIETSNQVTESQSDKATDKTRREIPNDQRQITIHLILGDINLRRPRRDTQYLFVNGRPVQNKNLSFALAQAYRLVLPPDEHPVFVAMITVPAQDVDANVHPTKREVKIRDEQNLFSELRRLCEQALMTKSGIKQVSEHKNYSGQNVSLRGVPPLQDEAISEIASSHKPGLAMTAEPPSSYGRAGSSTGYSYPSTPSTEFQNQLFALGSQPSADSLQKKLTSARVIGIFRTKYVLLECGDSMLLMDQHAAAERINYESLIVQMEKGSVEVQNLLAPVVLRLTSPDMLIWEKSKDALNELGFSTDLWKEDSIAVHSHPRVIRDIEATVRHILAGGAIAKRDHDVLARRACRCSIMTGDAIKMEEAEHLRARLLSCLDPLTCPHGRPTVIEMTEHFLDKQFLRT